MHFRMSLAVHRSFTRGVSVLKVFVFGSNRLSKASKRVLVANVVYTGRRGRAGQSGHQPEPDSSRWRAYSMRPDYCGAFLCTHLGRSYYGLVPSFSIINWNWEKLRQKGNYERCAKNHCQQSSLTAMKQNARRILTGLPNWVSSWSPI